MESQWIKDLTSALEQVGGNAVVPSVHSVLSAILVAKGIVTVAELKEIEDHFNNHFNQK